MTPQRESARAAAADMPARAPGGDESLAPVLTPRGALRVEARAECSEGGCPAAVAERIRHAFAAGPGAGLFHLGAAEATTPLLAGLAFWRDFARGFVTALCSVPDLDAKVKASTGGADGLGLDPPLATLEALVGAAPPMVGGEYLSREVLERLWRETESASARELAAFAGSAADLLHRKDPAWNLVGKVHFHLAEQKGKAATPFAFLATYTSRLDGRGKVQHLPLGRALREYAGAGNRGALLALLRPVHAASEKSPFLRALVDTQSIYQPLGWSPSEARRFLEDVPAFESAGIVVRVPDWWRRRGARRPQVRVQVGGAPAAGVGLDALLDFAVDVALDGETLTEAEVARLLRASDGLVLLRGRWVEVDSERLGQALAHWRAVEQAVAREGLSFLQGMRLLAGTTDDAAPGALASGETIASWSSRVAGPWLEQTLAALHRPAPGELGLAGELRATLRPYQEVGVAWLWRLAQLGLGACLADDMGLGKTVQVIAALLLARRRADGAARTSLLVVPASLIGNWRAEVTRFAPGLDLLVAHPSSAPSAELQSLRPDEVEKHDVVVTSYGFLSRLAWAQEFPWDFAILDEAQAIKNPGARQTRSVKSLRSRARVVLTGTPVENRLGDLWSLFDFANPGLLGSPAEFRALAKRLETRSEERFAPLRRLIAPYLLRRLKTDPAVIADLPDKTEVVAYCALTRTQAALYQQSVSELAERLETLEGIERRGVVLAYLTRFKQICNHPSQWLGDGAYRPAESGKFGRLRELCETLAERQEKVLVFTQYREMTVPLADHLAELFGRPGLVLHGQVPPTKRTELVRRFQEDDAIPFFVLSLKAGGTGLNLTAASQVIHFDRWWNPAVENQATDRAFRIGQKRNVLVHKFVCRGTVEEKVETLLAAKQRMSDELLEGGAETILTELDDRALLALVSLDVASAMEAA